MMQASELFRLTYATSFAVAGGRAPVYWQRELERSKARLDALRRSSGWVESLVADAPVLHDEPLMGRCLAVLTDRIGTLASQKPQVTRLKRPRSPWSVQPLQMDREMVSARHGSAEAQERGPQRSSAPLWSLAPRAGGELLSRLAGETPRVEGANPPLRPAIREPREPLGSRSGIASSNSPGEATNKGSLRGVDQRAGHSLRQDQLHELHGSGLGPRPRRGLAGGHARRLDPKTTRELLSPPEASPSICRRLPPHHDWLRNVAQRTAALIRQDGIGLDASRRALADRPWLDQAPALADQWAIALNGPSVSADLLARLADLFIGDTDGSPRKVGAGSASQSSTGTRSPGPSVAQAVGEAPSWQMLGLAVNQGETAVFGSEVGSRMGDVGDRPELHAELNPPAVASSLPPLIPPQVVGVPVPPVATAIARQGSRTEAASDEEDLSALADRIKRILDEQARRHGIDV